MMNMRKSVLAVIIAGTGFAGMAHAGSLVGVGATAQADVVFVESSSITNTLTPVSGLNAGEIRNMTVIANGVVDSMDGTAQMYATTFNGGDMSSTTADGTARTILSGKNDPSHKLDLYLNDTTPGTSGFKEVIDGKTYAVSGEPAVTQATYSVRANGAQNIAADTYTLSTISYVYTN